MNYRVQLFPLSGLRETEDSSLPNNVLQVSRPEWKDPQFFRSWIEYDLDFDPVRANGRIDWNRLLGLSLAFSLGAGFWTAAGLLIAYLW